MYTTPSFLALEFESLDVVVGGIGSPASRPRIPDDTPMDLQRRFDVDEGILLPTPTLPDGRLPDDRIHNDDWVSSPGKQLDI